MTGNKIISNNCVITLIFGEIIDQSYQNSYNYRNQISISIVSLRYSGTWHVDKLVGKIVLGQGRCFFIVDCRWWHILVVYAVEFVVMVFANLLSFVPFAVLQRQDNLASRSLIIITNNSTHEGQWTLHQLSDCQPKERRK